MLSIRSPRPPVLEEVIAWRAALSGWAWICFCMGAGLVRGVSAILAPSDPLAPQSLLHPAFLGLLFCMGLLLGGVWNRLAQSARLGYLNFTFSRMCWLTVFTLLGAGLWAGPSGAFEVMLETLSGLSSYPEERRALVLGRLVLGQGWIVLAVLPWLAFIVALFARLQVRAPLIPATLVAVMVLFLGAALALGFEALGMLFGLAVSD